MSFRFDCVLAYVTFSRATTVNGIAGSVFGQFAYCNAVAWFQTVTAAIKAGGVTIPPLGTDALGNICPTTRSFELVDQDPSGKRLESRHRPCLFRSCLEIYSNTNTIHTYNR